MERPIPMIKEEQANPDVFFSYNWNEFSREAGLHETESSNCSSTNNKLEWQGSDQFQLSDPENLIIAGNEEAAVADITPVDEERLLASDDELGNQIYSAPLQTVPPKDLEVFVSNDEEENRDNNDPQWETLKNLGSDHERYVAVRKRWRNMQVPNPKKDLTCRCTKPKTVAMVNGPVGINSVSETAVNQGVKRAGSPINNNRNKRFKRESCSVLYDCKIEVLVRETEQQKKRLEQEEEYALNKLADCQRLDQCCDRPQGRTPDDEVKLMNNDQHYRETIDCVRSFAARRNNLTEMAQQKIDALRLAAAEVRDFHEFYTANPNAQLNGSGDENSPVLLSEEEVQEIFETESMLTIRYESFYISKGSLT